MLGKHVVAEAQQRGYNISPRTPHPNDDVIINCAGRIPSKFDGPTDMIKSNAVLPWQLAACNIPLINMSTDCVFSGTEKKKLTSTTLPDPKDLYGRSKLCGEVDSPHVLNVRGSFIDLEHGFFRWVVDSRKKIKAWMRAYWNGGSARAMAHALVDLAETGPRSGVVHVAALQPVTKAWMVEYIVDALNLPIGEVILESEPKIWRALDPDIELPPVKDSLDELIGKWQDQEFQNVWK